MSIILLAGEIASGKSSVAGALQDRLHARVVRVRHELESHLDGQFADRRTLQILGAELDVATQGGWLVDIVRSLGLGSGTVLILDSVRTTVQASALRAAFSGVTLVYLGVDEATRRARYATARGDLVKSALTLDEAERHPTEAHAHDLARAADLVIDTGTKSIDDVANQIVSHLHG